ncbi:MAG TPA: protein kinase [Burkholderiaceae bacterium]|nr:protein kinase [Burkholderiaceae bacterium]
MTQGEGRESSNTLPVGFQLAEFRIERVIGEGGFGIVYLAHDTQLQRQVAVKEYMPSALAARGDSLAIAVKSERYRETFDAGLRSFVNEARLLAQFDHPALVKVYRFWEERGTAYMVMPYYEGPTLKDWRRAQPGPPPEPWLRTLLAALFDALELLHSRNCFHRDIAPDNILLLEDERGLRPLLLDFGAARRIIGDMTQALTVILKPGYAPVEQYADVSSMKQGPWTDIYALSAVLYFVAVGRPPPPAVGRMMADDFTPAQQLAGSIYSPRLLAAIDAGLLVKPEQRPQNIAAFRQLVFGAPTAAAGPATLGGSAAAAVDDDRTIIVPRAPSHRHATLPSAATLIGGQRGDPSAPPTGATFGAPLTSAALAGGHWPDAQLAGDQSLGEQFAGARSADVQAAPAQSARAPSGALSAGAQPGTPSANLQWADAVPANVQRAGAWGSGASAPAPRASPPTPGQSAPPRSGARSRTWIAAALTGVAVLGAVAVWFISRQPSAPVETTAAVREPAAVTPQGTEAAGQPGALLRRLFAVRDTSIQVDVQPGARALAIGRDTLSFSVRSSIAGYVYVLIAGTDDQHLALLFPNERDKDNRIAARTDLRLPRQNWVVNASGPAGINRLLVLVSPWPRDFAAAGLGSGEVFSEFSLDAARAAIASRGLPALAGVAQCPASEQNCAQIFGADFFEIQEYDAAQKRGS